MPTSLIIAAILLATLLIVALGLRVAPLMRIRRLGRPTIYELHGFPRAFELVGAQLLMITPLLIEPFRWTTLQEPIGWILFAMGLIGLMLIVSQIFSLKRAPAAYHVVGLKSTQLKAMVEDALHELGITFVEKRGAYQVSWPSTLLSGNPVVDPTTVGKCPFVPYRSMVAFHVGATGWERITTITTGKSVEISNAVIDAITRRLAEQSTFPSDSGDAGRVLTRSLASGVSGASAAASQGESWAPVEVRGGYAMRIERDEEGLVK